MRDIAIDIDTIGKQYVIGSVQPSYKTIRDALTELLKKPFRKITHANVETIWALKDVSFRVKEGEVIGIIGRNGSGKSTLLKILSRITKPTLGRAVVNGRVGSLLEVGTGFHQELTGRENIFLNGAILGMKKAEIDKKFDAIVEFSEIEKFLDTPVKRYSSGMYVRLAFAVAAHLDPEVLIVDEVLAVGDVAFQKKCLGKMGELSKSGRTVLFVSHNLGVINQLCERTVWLDKGSLIKIGATQDVVHQYLQFGNLTEASGSWTSLEANSANERVRLLSASVLTAEGIEVSIVNFEKDFYIEVKYEVLDFTEVWSLILRLKNDSGTPIFTSWDTDLVANSKPLDPGRHSMICCIPGKFLRPGTYTVSLGIHLPRAATFNVEEDIFQFQVSSVGYPMNLNRRGMVTPVLQWFPRTQLQSLSRFAVSNQNT